MAILSIGELLGIGPDELSGFVPYTDIHGSGNLISGIGASALSAGLDSATVSAIASAYADSAVSGASSSYYPMTGNPSGFLVNADLAGYATTTYVDSSVSGKADESALSAYQPVSGMSAYAYESSLSSKVDQTAFEACCSSVESAISALTDSASAVASGLSGKLDNSASSTWYPMTGNPSGFLVNTDLDGYATTEYVDSSVSSKVDQSAFDDCCSSVQSAISSLSGDMSGKQDISGMSAYALSSDVSSVISVVESSSGSWGGGGDYVEKSAMEVTIGSANTAYFTAFSQGSSNYAYNEGVAIGIANSANSNALAQGRRNSAISEAMAQGWQNTAYTASLAQGASNYAGDDSLAQGGQNTAHTGSFAQGVLNRASGYSFAQGHDNYAYDWGYSQGGWNSASSSSFAQGLWNSARNEATAFGKYNLHGDGAQTGDSAAFVIGDGTAESARHDLLLVTKDGEIRTYSATSDTTGLPIVATLRALSAWATANGWTGV